MLSILAIALAAVPTAAQIQVPAEFGWFGQLAGACWRGEHPGGRLRDEQCYSGQFGRFMRGTIALTPAGRGRDGPSHEGDSVFAWDSEQRRILFYFWGSDGRHGVSHGFFEGDDLVFPSAPESAGQAAGRRTVWRRIDAESYRVSVQTQVDGRWTDQMQVIYRKSGEGPGATD